MPFKKDFIDLLTKYGRLPIKTVKQGLDLCAENEQLKEQLIAFQAAFDNQKKELIEAKLLLNESSPHTKTGNKTCNIM